MASVDYQNSILWRGEDPLKKKFKPTLDKSAKVVRYFPGKAPRWVPKEGEEERDKRPEERRSEERRSEERRGSRKHEKRRKVAAEVLEPAAPSGDAASSRLKRLSAFQPTEDSRSERLLRHRSLHEARVLEASAEEKAEQAEEEVKDEEKVSKTEDADEPGVQAVRELAFEETGGDDANDNELQSLRREKARELALLRRKEEEVLLKEEEEAAGPAEEDEDEEESEEESESDDDPRRAAMLKPVFVSKTQRETVREKEALQKEEEEAERREKEKVKERKVESKSLLIDEIKRDDEAELAGFNENDASDIELIDDNDEKNEAEEYELWKIRELKRIKRDKEERLDRQKELDWIEKRRAMTEEEREADDRRLDDSSNKKEEAKQFNFLQKYYHRGGFFQDKAVAGDEPLYLRDYHEPLEEEKYDKNLLPKTMQLRRGQFGKKGQVKHSHLTEVDTTDFNAAWSQHSKQVQKYQERMASAKGVNNFDRPSSSSKS